MAYLVVEGRRHTKAGDVTVTFGVEDENGVYGPNLQSYREGSGHTVMGTYPRNGSGFMQAIDDIRRHTVGMKRTVVENRSYLASAEVLKRLSAKRPASLPK